MPLGRGRQRLLGLWHETKIADFVFWRRGDDGCVFYDGGIDDVAGEHCHYFCGLVAVAAGLLTIFKMKTTNGFFAALFLLLFPPLSGTSAPASSTAENSLPNTFARDEKADWISAADPRFCYEGRLDFSDSNAPVVIWQASRIALDFEGTTLVLFFDDAKGQNFFNAQVDGSNTVVEVHEGAVTQPVMFSGLGPGRHHLALFKRSEASAGTVRFRGMEIGPNTKAWASPKTPYKLKMEFIGDSITVGACNEDGAADQWDNRRTHNSAFSYAALTATEFSADHRNIAVSGMGIATGWVEPKAGEIWDRLYPNPASPRADLPQWTPQIVFVNFGENDASFSGVHGQPFPTNFTAGYVSLAQAIRKTYPAAKIVLLRGGMFNGAQSGPLRQAWESTVTQLEATDKAISHFVFQHWTANHPRVADDRAMADELTAWLKQQKFMQPYQ
jgi:lysophospholipase L1-like esterase